jgi:hypothetical protein
MGIPITTPMGATGGAGTFTAVNHGPDLALITTQLTTLNGLLTAQATANETKYWGTVAALGVPGSPASSLANSALMLAEISDTLTVMRRNQDTLSSTLKELSTSVKLLSSSASRMENLQSMAIADQISMNQFQKSETVAALKRNNIEPAPLPTFEATLKEVVTGATTMHGLAEFQSFSQSITNKAFEMAKDWITTTYVYTAGEQAIKELMTTMGLTKILAKAADPVAEAAELAKQVGLTSARTGVWKPTFVPPGK